MYTPAQGNGNICIDSVYARGRRQHTVGLDTEVNQLLIHNAHRPNAYCLQVKLGTRYSAGWNRIIFIGTPTYTNDVLHSRALFWHTELRYFQRLPLQHCIRDYGIYINLDNITFKVGKCICSGKRNLTHSILNRLTQTIYWKSPVPILGTSGYEIYIFLEKKLFANSGDPDQTPQNALFANYPFTGLTTTMG